MKRNFSLIVVDGRHLLWRCSDAYKSLTAEVDGKVIGTGGIYGFLGALVRLSRRYGGKVVIAWEGTDNFRFGLFPGYKARDKKQDVLSQEMDDQQARLSEILQALGVRQYSGEKCEADDVIGRLSRLGKKGYRVAVYSGDSDLRQLVTDRVTVIAHEKTRDRVYDAPAVEEKHGVPPRMIAALKALSGDHSDKIPGLPGIGPKTAVTLLRTYESLPRIVKAARRAKKGWPVAERFRAVISENEDKLRLFYRLTRIKTDVRTIAIRPKPDRDKAIRLLKLYKFRSLVFSPDLGALLRVGGA